MPFWDNLQTLVSYAADANGSRAVSPRWLLRRESAINRRFRQTARVETREDGEWQRIEINGQAFYWPRKAPVESLVTLAGELQLPMHPHQYLWGATRIRSGDVVLDIGACEGGFSCKASQVGARVIAVEPSAVMQEAIRRLYAEAEVAGPEIAPVLLGNKGQQQLHFLDDARNPGHSRICASPVEGSYPVRLTTLDSLCDELALDRLDFLKCDAEGAEMDIIEGGLQAIDRLRPKIAFCTYHRDDHFLEISRRLRGLGYSIQGKGFHRVGARLRVLMLHAVHPEGRR